MKLRIAKSEWSEVRACAAEIGEDGSEWIRRAVKQYHAAVGTKQDSPNPTEGAVGCSEAECTTVDHHVLYDAWVIRACIRRGLEHCRKQKKSAAPPFVTLLLEGRDYIIGRPE